MAIERAFPVCSLRSWNTSSDFRNHWCAEGHVRDEMPVHDVDMEPAFVRKGSASWTFRGVFCSASEYERDRKVALGAGAQWEMGKGGMHQSAPLSMVSVQAAPRAAKSAERMEGAMIAGGDISSGGMA